MSAIIAHFQANDRLAADDVTYLPGDLVKHLDLTAGWQERGVSAFSRKVDQGTYMFAANKRSMGHSARAVLAQPVSPTEWRWKPLALPFIQPEGRIEAREAYGHISWNSATSTAEVVECTDVTSEAEAFQCAKMIYRVRWQDSALIRIEGSKPLSKDWTVVWEKGTWKPHTR